MFIQNEIMKCKHTSIYDAIFNAHFYKEGTSFCINTSNTEKCRNINHAMKNFIVMQF